MRILFISPRQCWPARSGARLREFHFLRALGQKGDVTYLHFTEPGAVPLSQADLPFCRDVIAVPKPKAYGGLQLVQGLVGPWPLPILNYTSDQMEAAVAKITAAHRFDLIHLDSIHMIRYGGWHPNLVYNWHNIESEAMRRYAGTAPSFARRWYARHTAAGLERLERRILQEALGHLVCSERERESLLRIVPDARVAVVENGVDAPFFAEGTPDAAAPPKPKLVFVGSMDYFPNVDGAVSFTQRIWPEIRRRMPEMTLAIVGANPVPAVRALAELPGVTVTGTVPDVRPWYHGAAAAVVPLRTGGGTRLKILEAMAAGVAVISTELGAEGLAVTPGRNFLLAGADDAEAWIEHLGRLERTPRLRAEIVESALDLVRTRYDWEILGRTLNDTYSAWLRESS